MKRLICWIIVITFLLSRLLIIIPDAKGNETPDDEVMVLKDISGNCRELYTSWLRYAGYYSAFAYSKSGYCGLSWEQDTRLQARTVAIQNCLNFGDPSPCEVLYEKDETSPGSRDANLCRFEQSQLALQACSRLLDAHPHDTMERPRLLTNRGFHYDLHGYTDLAMSNFVAAIKIDGSYGHAYWQIALIHRRMGEDQKALFSAGLALWHFRSNFFDYRASAKTMIDDIAKVQALLASKSSYAVCSSALNYDKSGFGGQGGRQVYKNEAVRRYLSFQDCRLLLGYPAAVNPFESSTDFKLCLSALNSTGSGWNDSDTNGQLAQTEALRRRLTLDSCISAKSLNAPPNSSQDLPSFLTVEICSWAMHWNGLDWDGSDKAKPYLVEAKRRKLSKLDCQRALGFPVAATPN